MNGTRESTGRISAAASSNPLKAARQVLLGLFLVVAGVLTAQAVISFPLPAPGVWDAGALLIAVVTTLTSLSRQLPLQNVLLAAFIVGAISGAIHLLGAITGIPFGPVVYSRDAGPQLFSSLSWAIPVIWIAALLNSRGVARLILRPWRKLRVYGFWLIGLTTILTVLFDCGLEPFATRFQHYWVWRSTKIPIDWYGAPLSNFLGWMVTALLVLAFATPSLINKKPAKSAPDYHPLVVWIASNVLFIAAALSHHFWLAAAVSGIACIAVLPLAVRGARW